MTIRALLFAWLLCGSAFAEQAQTFGDVEVHYNVMPTSSLLPEVARAYKIERSDNRGLLTISVVRKNPLGVGEPVKAEVKATAANLSAQFTTIRMRELKEAAAIYYLGEFRVSPPETLRFTVNVKPAGHGQTHTLEFQQQFYR